MKLLHIYPQYMEHSDARIVGNREGLLELRRALDEALDRGSGETVAGADCLYATDGEGYHVKIISGAEDWEDPYWGKEELRPFYTVHEGSG